MATTKRRVRPSVLAARLRAHAAALKAVLRAINQLEADTRKLDRQLRTLNADR